MISVLIWPREDFITRDALFENPEVKADDMLIIVFRLEVGPAYFEVKLW